MGLRLSRREKRRLATLVRVSEKYGVNVQAHRLRGWLRPCYYLYMIGTGHNIYRWLRLLHIQER